MPYRRTRALFSGRSRPACLRGGRGCAGRYLHLCQPGYTAERAQELARLTGCSLTSENHSLAGALRDSLCLLQKSYRFGSDSGIGQLAAAVNRGDRRTTTAVFDGTFTDIEKNRCRPGKSIRRCWMMPCRVSALSDGRTTAAFAGAGHCRVW